MGTTTRTGGDNELRERVRKRVSADGIAVTARYYRVGVEAIARYLAGLEVREGTKALIREREAAR